MKYLNNEKIKVQLLGLLNKLLIYPTLRDRHISSSR